MDPHSDVRIPSNRPCRPCKTDLPKARVCHNLRHGKFPRRTPVQSVVNENKHWSTPKSAHVRDIKNTVVIHVPRGYNASVFGGGDALLPDRKTLPEQ